MPQVRSAHQQRLHVAQQAAGDFGGVVSRALLASLGVDRHHIRRQVESGRWALHGHQTVAVHPRPLTVTEQHWRAIWEVGERIAVLDGVSALTAAGMTMYAEEQVHVSVPRNARVGRVPGVRVHRIPRRLPGEVVAAGVPRTLPAAAAIRAAHWASSDAQAALLLCLPVQQRLVTPTALQQTRRLVSGRSRRALLAALVDDLADGAHSLGELDFAARCRRRGLPPPSRQVVRRGSRGRVYLDVAWEAYRVVVEIDGSGHRVGLSVTHDNLRQNEVALSGETVLRIDLVGLRIAGDAFQDQVEAALRRAGWRPVTVARCG